MQPKNSYKDDCSSQSPPTNKQGKMKYNQIIGNAKDYNELVMSIYWSHFGYLMCQNIMKDIKDLVKYTDNWEFGYNNGPLIYENSNYDNIEFFNKYYIK